MACRYDQQQGLLTLVCTRYADRDANQRHIVRMIHMLIEAGHTYSPAEGTHQKQSYEGE